MSEITSYEELQRLQPGAVIEDRHGDRWSLNSAGEWESGFFPPISSAIVSVFLPASLIREGAGFTKGQRVQVASDQFPTTAPKGSLGLVQRIHSQEGLVEVYVKDYGLYSFYPGELEPAPGEEEVNLPEPGEPVRPEDLERLPDLSLVLNTRGFPRVALRESGVWVGIGTWHPQHIVEERLHWAAAEGQVFLISSPVHSAEACRLLETVEAEVEALAA